MMVIIGDDNGDDEIGDAEGGCVVIIIFMTVGDEEDAHVVIVIIMTVGDAEDAR